MTQQDLTILGTGDFWLSNQGLISSNMWIPLKFYSHKDIFWEVSAVLGFHIALQKTLVLLVYLHISSFLMPPSPPHFIPLL